VEKTDVIEGMRVRNYVKWVRVGRGFCGWVDCR
jgi:hypothetical protein